MHLLNKFCTFLIFHHNTVHLRTSLIPLYGRWACIELCLVRKSGANTLALQWLKPFFASWLILEEELQIIINKLDRISGSGNIVEFTMSFEINIRIFVDRLFSYISLSLSIDFKNVAYANSKMHYLGVILLVDINYTFLVCVWATRFALEESINIKFDSVLPRF